MAAGPGQHLGLDVTQHRTDLHQVKGDGGVFNHGAQLCKNLQHRQEVVAVCFSMCRLLCLERPLLEGFNLQRFLTTETIFT